MRVGTNYLQNYDDINFEEGENLRLNPFVGPCVEDFTVAKHAGVVVDLHVEESTDPFAPSSAQRYQW